MDKKGFEANMFIEETPNSIETAEKPFNIKLNREKKVDINELKARAQKIRDKENKKNYFIIMTPIINKLHFTLYPNFLDNEKKYIILIANQDINLKLDSNYFDQEFYFIVIHFFF